MGKTINISLDSESISKAISEIKKYSDVEKRMKELAKRLAELGKSVAQLNYGDSHVTVTVIERNNGFDIQASGQDVCFIEFGAGVRTNSGHPFADKMPFDVQQGSWSVQDKQQFYTWGYWYYGGVKLDSIEPHNAMYLASRYIQDNVLKIAKEVFK